jgi:hypothetical protein
MIETIPLNLDEQELHQRLTWCMENCQDENWFTSPCEKYDVSWRDRRNDEWKQIIDKIHNEQPYIFDNEKAWIYFNFLNKDNALHFKLTWIR